MLCQQSFVQGKILHQMNIDEIAYVIAKKCCAPYPIACWKTCHLRNQARLSGDNLIHTCTISWLNLSGLTDTATSLALPTP